MNKNEAHELAAFLQRNYGVECTVPGSSDYGMDGFFVAMWNKSHQTCTTVSSVKAFVDLSKIAHTLVDHDDMLMHTQWCRQNGVVNNSVSKEEQEDLEFLEHRK